MPIHDHFEGSAHCVECGGPCKLTGDARALTEMIRWRLEARPFLNPSERETIRKAGGDPDKLIARAKECNPALVWKTR